MSIRNIIVIGASTGGFEAIQSIVANLPPNLPASIFVVWHISPEVQGLLPNVLNKYETLPAINAFDGQLIEQGHIYVAPPDHHLMLEAGKIRVTRGPKENRFRPAVDPLFRSAAYEYGPQVIGIVLSGALDDGTAGLWMIKHFGGIAIVQNPADAVMPSMPENALREVKVDYSVAVSAMPALLERLCAAPIPANLERNEITPQEQESIQQELNVAKGDIYASEKIKRSGELSPFTCPECHGVLFTLHDGKITRYRCHTGHAYSAESLLSAITGSIEDSLWSVIRTIEEGIMLLNNRGDHYAELNDPGMAAPYFQRAKEAGERLEILKDMVNTNEHPLLQL
jgi:two-component system, chemotaxis family, protein-glutamate methylesterase/glutaminase